MKELINFCAIPGYEEQTAEEIGSLASYLKQNGLAGIELFRYHNESNLFSYKAETVGVHLKFWPFWLDFWRGEGYKKKLLFTDEKAMRDYYFGAITPDEWLEQIRINIRLALEEEPEYLVWHISESDTEEIFTFKFKHTNYEVLQAAAEVYNAVRECVPPSVTVLFENLWWPGLRLTEPEAVAYFFERVRGENTGLILDAGHLLNTNPSLRSEDEGMAYILRILEALGVWRKKIRGIHFNASFSGEYQRSFERSVPLKVTQRQIMKHVSLLDCHQPWRTAKAAALIDLVKPDYLVHELYYADFKELAEFVALQKLALRRG